jgi:hypothetical protein
MIGRTFARVRLGAGGKREGEKEEREAGDFHTGRLVRGGSRVHQGADRRSRCGYVEVR